MEQLIYKEGSIGHDIQFLEGRDEELIVLKIDSAHVVISPKYQGKVFTSSATGLTGKSLGWINYGAFDKMDEHMNAYGGENRLWLGPEGGKYSLFFKSGDSMVFNNWKTPPPIDTEVWKTIKKNSAEVQLEKEMTINNYSNAQFDITTVRTVKLFSKDQIAQSLNIDLGSLKSVGFKTSNKITNIGPSPWTKETGAPCIWILDMFKPSDETVIMIPFDKNAVAKVATTDYFGEISPDRINFLDSVVLYKADGRARGKIGIPPTRAKKIAGSYDSVGKLLTVTVFDVDKDAVYLNQEWKLDKDPFAGDAINAYNDGPLEDGSQMGPFYEIESVSPAAFLAPQESLVHDHSVYHFTGEEKEMDKIVQRLFGITLKEVNEAFNNQ
tara:strand:+ start:9810 stop:10955 length:1146 start_codon:yes stop_codon:yes gene_type:complete